MKTVAVKIVWVDGSATQYNDVAEKIAEDFVKWFCNPADKVNELHEVTPLVLKHHYFVHSQIRAMSVFTKIDQEVNLG